MGGKLMTGGMGLTARQAELMRFIQSFGPVSPLYSEMMQAAGATSTSTISRLLDALEERGYISRLRHRQPAITILRRAPAVEFRVIYGPGHFEDRARIKRAEYAREAA